MKHKGYIDAKKEDFVNPEDYNKYLKNLKHWHKNIRTRDSWLNYSHKDPIDKG